MSLPSFNTSDRTLSMLQDQWTAQLNPVLANPLVAGRLIQNVTLASGTNTINTLLGRKLQGYIVVLKSANVTIYDTQSTNTMPDKTLQLTSSGAVVITLWVF